MNPPKLYYLYTSDYTLVKPVKGRTKLASLMKRSEAFATSILNQRIFVMIGGVEVMVKTHKITKVNISKNTKERIMYKLDAIKHLCNTDRFGVVEKTLIQNYTDEVKNLLHDIKL